jgi:hypothetical protein
MHLSGIFEKSAIVCAHPDDEVLWFSSILDKVDKVIICFLGIRSEPNYCTYRQKTLSEYPLKNVFCLGIEEAETFYGVDWEKPVITKYGLEISDKKYPDRKYRENYATLKNLLEVELKGCLNVFTHNPWGEYGSDEHVQLYRAVTDLQKSLNYHIWFSNYTSNKSYKLMLQSIDSFNFDYITLLTNKVLSGNIKKIYQKNNCWTWYDDWEWFDNESFLRDRMFQEEVKKNSRTLPLNFIKVWLPKKSQRQYSIFD